MANRLFDLTGRVALVTGGNRGLGLAMAGALAAAGASVAIAARDQERARQAAADLGGSGQRVTSRRSTLLIPRPVHRWSSRFVAVREGRHPGQQRRRQHTQAPAGLHQFRLVGGDQVEPVRRVPPLPARAPRSWRRAAAARSSISVRCCLCSAAHSCSKSRESGLLAWLTLTATTLRERS